MKVKSEREVTQSCPTPSDPMDCSPPGSSIHGIFQARVLEWGAIAFSKILCNNLMVPRGKDGGRDSQGVWDGHGHTAVFNIENQQRPAVQHRELCSVPRGSLAGGEFEGHGYVCMDG